MSDEDKTEIGVAESESKFAAGPVTYTKPPRPSADR